MRDPNENVKCYEEKTLDGINLYTTEEQNELKSFPRGIIYTLRFSTSLKL